jgi:hypothetical protein
MIVKKESSIVDDSFFIIDKCALPLVKEASYQSMSTMLIPRPSVWDKLC